MSWDEIDDAGLFAWFSVWKMFRYWKENSFQIMLAWVLKC